MRTFIDGLDDVERGADALTQAEAARLHAERDRETAQLADGYRIARDMLVGRTRQLEDLPQERDYLTRAAEAYRLALASYARAPASDRAEQHRRTQRALAQVEQSLGEGSRPPPARRAAVARPSPRR